MSESNLVRKVDDYVFSLFKNSSEEKLIFHNYKHTVDVFNAVVEIGKESSISDEELEIVSIAALFHDVGYFEKCDGHEEISAEIAQKFLEKEKYSPKNIESVLAGIRATKMGVEPSNLLEEIICDSDTKNIGTPEYVYRSTLLRMENKAMKGTDFSDFEWLQWELKFLRSHRFYTRYAVLNYNDEKAKNITLRQEELNKIQRKNVEQKDKDSAKEVKLKKSEVPQRGIETMFRTTLRNHINLSAIADNKANLMLSVNAIIISIIVSLMLPNYKHSPELIIPSVFLLTVCLMSIVFATLSTRPKITQGTFTKEDIESKKANLLFFGNFYNSKLEEFEWGMNEMMKDRDFLYGAMIRDLHSLGMVLNKKYRYLRLTYNIFMYGMILSVILFGIFMNMNTT